MSVLLLPGWRCRACPAFNGEAKGPLASCRACGAARPTSPRRVILESPYAASTFTGASVREHEEYGRRCLRDSLLRGEAPLASHLLYTQPIDGHHDGGMVLHDLVPEERALGIEAGLAWGPLAEATVAYVDMGVSIGMLLGFDRARAEHRPVECRSLGDGCPALEAARWTTAPETWAKLEAGGWL